MSKRIVLLLALLILLSGCQTNPEPTIVELDIFYLNDFHGAMEPSENQMGASAIAAFLSTQHTHHDPIILTGGDMLQGSYLSNVNQGLLTLQWLNHIGVSAATLGNHEFDWGLDAKTMYYTGQHDIQAQHPLLGANVVYKGTTTLPEGVQPYTILNRQGLKIGIIGLMGYGLESTILSEHIADYAFLEPVAITHQLTQHLRTVEAVDVVLVVIHGADDDFNEAVAQFEGDAKVDAIFNGHTHRETVKTMQGIPIMQAGGNGSAVGYLRLTIEEGEVIAFEPWLLNQDNEARLWLTDESTEFMIESFKAEHAEAFETLLVSDRFHARSELARYVATLMLHTYEVDFAFHNLGGTRQSLLPDQDISEASLYAILPFDNTVVTLRVPGYRLHRLIDFNPQYASRLTDVDDEAWYDIAVNNYLYTRDYYLLSSYDATTHPQTLHELLVEAMRYYAQTQTRFNASIHPPRAITLESLESSQP